MSKKGEIIQVGGTFHVMRMMVFLGLVSRINSECGSGKSLARGSYFI